MPDKDKTSDRTPKKNNESASASVAAGPVEDSKSSEKYQLTGNDPTAVMEAAKSAEMAVSDAVRGITQIIDAMKEKKVTLL